MQREEMIALRANLLLGAPHYEKDAMGNFVRAGRSGTPGLHELQKMGDFNPLAPTLRMVMETQVKILDHLLEHERDEQEDEG